MSQALHPTMTTEAFLEWERRQDLRWEFDGTTPRAMTGGTNAHATIEVNLLTALHNRLAGSPCRVIGSTLKVRIGTRIRYPDALITCTPAPRDSDIAPEPVVLFEVLSKSTSRTDRSSKLLEYRSLDSVQRYVLLEQDQVLATVYARQGTGWTVEQLVAGDTLAMPEAGVTLPVDELYRGVELPPALQMGIEEV